MFDRCVEGAWQVLEKAEAITAAEQNDYHLLRDRLYAGRQIEMILVDFYFTLCL